MKAAAPLLLLLLAGCAQSLADPPSLLPRANEIGIPTLPAVPTGPAPSSPAVTARIAELLNKARAGQAAFERVLAGGGAALAAGRGARAGSEAFLRAQEIRSALEAARRPTTEALADLDRLRIEAVAAGNDDRPILDAQAQVQALLRGQDAAI